MLGSGIAGRIATTMETHKCITLKENKCVLINDEKNMIAYIWAIASTLGRAKEHCLGLIRS